MSRPTTSSPERLNWPRRSSATDCVAKTGHAPLLSDEMRFGDEVVPVPDQAVVFEAARALGLDIVIDPYVATERWLDEAGVRDTAARLNRAAELAADYGLQVGYHNHSQEFIATVQGRTRLSSFSPTSSATTWPWRSTCTGRQRVSRMWWHCSVASGNG